MTVAWASETTKRSKTSGRTTWLAVAALGAAVGLSVPWVRAHQRARRLADNEARIVMALRTIDTGQALFREGDKDHDQRFQFAQSVDELVDAGMIPDYWQPSGGGHVHAGYRITFQPVSTDEFLFAVLAEPVEPGVSGDRRFLLTPGRLCMDEAPTEVPLPGRLTKEVVPDVRTLLPGLQ